MLSSPPLVTPYLLDRLADRFSTLLQTATRFSDPNTLCILTADCNHRFISLSSFLSEDFSQIRAKQMMGNPLFATRCARARFAKGNLRASSPTYAGEKFHGRIVDPSVGGRTDTSERSKILKTFSRLDATFSRDTSTSFRRSTVSLISVSLSNYVDCCLQ